MLSLGHRRIRRSANQRAGKASDNLDEIGLTSSAGLREQPGDMITSALMSTTITPELRPSNATASVSCCIWKPQQTLQCTRATTIRPSCPTQSVLGNSAPRKQNSRGGASSIWMMDVPAGVGACSGNAETPNHLIRNGLAPDAAIRTAAGPDTGLAPLDRELARERQAMGDVEARAAELTNLGGDVEEL